MISLATENFSSYTAGSTLPSIADAGFGFISSWLNPSGATVNAQSGSWSGKYISLNSSSSNLQRYIPERSILDFSCEVMYDGSSLVFFGIVAGGKEYKFVNGAGGFNEVRHNGTSSAISNPFTNGVVKTARIYIDSTITTNNVIFYIDGTAVATFSDTITSLSAPMIQFAMSGYGSGIKYGNIQVQGNSLDQNLIRAYNFDGNSTDSKNGYNGSDNSVSYSTSYGKIGQGVNISGGDTSYISTVSTGLPMGSSKRTISIWFKTSNTSNNAFVSYGNAASNGYRFQLMTTSAGVPYISGFGNDLVGNGNYNDGKWHNMIATYDGSTAKLYMDGVLNASGSVSFNTQNTNLYFGKYSGDGDNLNGNLDMCLIWNRVISEDEAKQIFNSARANAYPLTNAPDLYGGTNGYKFDESSGNASDSIGGYTATNNSSATYSAGKINNGINLNGSSQYFNFANCPQTGNNPFTITAWIKGSSFASAGCIAGFGTGNTSQGVTFDVRSSKLYADFYGSTSIAGSTTLSTGTYYFVTLTYDGTYLKLYLNNSLDGTSASTSAGIVAGSGAIGRAFWASGNFFNGQIDEVYFFNRVLSSTELTILYNSGNAKQYPWGGASITLTDASTIVDSLFKTPNKILFDSNTPLDILRKAIGKFVSESSITSDLVNKSTSRSITESKTMSDSVNKRTSRSLNDSSTILDTITNIKILFKLLVESFTSSDFISKGISKLLTETKSLTDNLSKGLSKIFSEISSITEVFVRYIAKIIELFETTTIFEDFRLFINNKVARWKDLFSSKSSTWNDKDSNKNTNWIDKLKL